MAARSTPYEAKHEIDGLEGLSNKLTTDMRRHVRMLGKFPVFTTRWMDMADSLERIGNITEMERKLPKEDKDATLWDCEEVALRYFMEDGKLNVCLRALVAAKEAQWRMLATDESVTPEMKEKMRKFEIGAGLTLKNVWDHVEAVQTTDLPLLLEHIGNVLERTVSDTSQFLSDEDVGTGSACDSWPLLQETMVLHYVRALAARMDCVDEERLLGLAAEQHLIGRAAAAMVHLSPRMQEGDMQAGAEGLALLCDSEDFAANESELIGDHADSVVALGDVLSPLLTDAASRRRVRPLMDLVRRLKRRGAGK